MALVSSATSELRELLQKWHRNDAGRHYVHPLWTLAHAGLMIASIITFFPIVTNTTRGLKSADPRILDFMHSINATRREIFFKVQLPAALPFIFAGFKIAASLSLVGAVVAEFYGSDRGLGYLVITSATQLRTDLLFVSIIVLAALGVSLFAIFGKLERMAIRGEVDVERPS